MTLLDTILLTLLGTVTEDWLDTLSCARPKIYSVTTAGIHIHQCDTMVCKTAAYIEYISRDRMVCKTA